MFRKFLALFRRRDDRVPIFDLYAYDPQRETKRHLRAEITIARESDRRHTAMREKIRRRCVARGQRLRDRPCS